MTLKLQTSDAAFDALHVAADGRGVYVGKCQLRRADLSALLNDHAKALAELRAAGIDWQQPSDATYTMAIAGKVSATADLFD